ncbi:uncharacterized protein Z520_06949 [Fonsecaea multimorphosa CBS 102226]|uniref:Uncharacterized protein n=1 Tax=Fonsecaea multimorphosa CBS 102226 TaxID=1442371 RepID=A0A0D2JVK7_9EURO|nr:uncharacterized protein Z520_06949 [Fonsecaea multimorphosa CBS 102226]KIX97497.1 hypothetical protein Z520_06949 [Fonsecaea multimorphosa CBS 102226]
MASSSGLWNTATTWSTRYQPCTSTLTSTATATLTPAASTSTITVTSTATITGSTSFSTAIQTTTVTSTTDSTTATDTTTTTTTTTTLSISTSTVAAPATFTPIQTSLPGSTYSGSGGSDPISKREAKAGGSRDSSNKAMLSQPGLSEWRYPQGVVCHQSVSETCSTKTTITTSTITATAKTVTATSTSITTTTVIPSGTTTSTSTVTTTVTSVITETSTSTSTSTATTYSTTTTVYAACATNNLADEYLGEYFLEVSGGFTSVYDTTTDDAYDCCVAAITLGDTSVWAWLPGEPSNNCEVGQTDGTCPDPATNPSTATYGASSPITVGNAYCGGINAAVPLLSSSSSSS